MEKRARPMYRRIEAEPVPRRSNSMRNVLGEYHLERRVSHVLVAMSSFERKMLPPARARSWSALLVPTSLRVLVDRCTYCLSRATLLSSIELH